MISRQYISEIRLKREEVESFDRYPFCLPAVRPLEKIEFHPAVTFFIGENGSGKSTLLDHQPPTHAQVLDGTINPIFHHSTAPMFQVRIPVRMHAERHEDSKTDEPTQHFWSPQSGAKYKVLCEQIFKLAIE